MSRALVRCEEGNSQVYPEEVDLEVEVVPGEGRGTGACWEIVVVIVPPFGLVVTIVVFELFGEVESSGVGAEIVLGVVVDGD